MEKKKTRIYMGIPSNGTVVDFQAYMLRDIAEIYKDEVELVYPKHLTQRFFHDFARNEIVEEFLRSDCDILWFLDSDITPNKHVLDLVTKHGDKWLAAGAPYPVFMNVPNSNVRQVVFTAYKGQGQDGKGLVPTVIPYEGTEFVDGLATGCLFLKREIFEKHLERPWFEFKYDPVTRMPIEGEDIGLALKLREKGIKFFTDYSMVCKHYKHVCLLELNNYAVEFANQTVRNYQEMVRAQVRSKVMAQRPSKLIINK